MSTPQSLGPGGESRDPADVADPGHSNDSLADEADASVAAAGNDAEEPEDLEAAEHASAEAGSAEPGAPSSGERRRARVRLTPEERRERRRKRSERLRSELLNLPNGVTMLRIALIPVFLAFLTYENRRNSFIAAVVFSVAAISDWIDGWLARVTKKITTLGKFLDPLADKLIVLSALVMLLRLGRVPVWVVVLIFAREFLISGLRTIAATEGLVISASQGGKWKTSLQLTGIICLFVHYQFRIDYFVASLQTDFQLVGATLLYLSLIPGVASAIEYVRAFYTLDTGDGQR